MDRNSIWKLRFRIGYSKFTKRHFDQHIYHSRLELSEGGRGMSKKTYSGISTAVILIGGHALNRRRLAGWLS
ncbi:hypothetical protein CA54_36360 [Symmachiella macrocystis]|uniref:Uncharacterized protein n=1 Tax=Symmachiella macrocystis TaxID=2527985 RepID=A0A5C6BSS0_9PLAN|nr:hypothetical protein CA54_36360 [Symmachiella macrocystis]